MGRLIIEYKNGKIESFKCNSKERAMEVASKRNFKEWRYYERGERIPERRKKEIKRQPQSFEELERLMRMNQLLDRAF